MTLLKKIQILTDSAKYDASCSSSGSSGRTKGSFGSTATGGICHSWAADGRCISLLKILMTNICIYDCAYCLNRSSNDIPRAILSPEEICDITINFYRKNYIEGLFLSTGVVRNPDYTMELLIKTVKLLRETHGFRGYIHLKLIPGADKKLIEIAGRYADRVSVNIELPSQKSLSLLAPQKKISNIIKPMEQVHETLSHYKAERKKKRKPPLFSPAGQSTQLIIGATPETDYHILTLSKWLYKKVDLKRVYYSAYIPVNNWKNLPAIQQPPLLREHRLYQADWLMRFYYFSADEIVDSENQHLDTDIDPKTAWALRNIHYFPVEINKADYLTLLRVPGIGVVSAKKILSLRKVHSIDFDDLKKLKIVLKRAQYFITAKGKYYSDIKLDPVKIRTRIILPSAIKASRPLQLDLFADLSQDKLSAVSGEF